MFNSKNPPGYDRSMCEKCKWYLRQSDCCGLYLMTGVHHAGHGKGYNCECDQFEAGESAMAECVRNYTRRDNENFVFAGRKEFNKWPIGE